MKTHEEPMMVEDIVRIDIDKELFALIASLESSIKGITV